MANTKLDLNADGKGPVKGKNADRKKINRKPKKINSIRRLQKGLNFE